PEKTFVRNDQTENAVMVSEWTIYRIPVRKDWQARAGVLDGHRRTQQSLYMQLLGLHEPDGFGVAGTPVEWCRGTNKC
ncbi:MAG: hypothetical protein P8M26_02520, partial [Gammaproteobacteria bacterium]|nr:hypothetical protein [Gammaproteobacteria bacterium]